MLINGSYKASEDNFSNLESAENCLTNVIKILKDKEFLKSNVEDTLSWVLKFHLYNLT